MNYKLKSAMKERELHSMRVPNRRAGLNWEEVLFEHKDECSLRDRGGAQTFLTRRGQHCAFWQLEDSQRG